MPSEGGVRSSEVGSKSTPILGANSVTLSTKYLGKLGFYHQLCSHRYAFPKAGGDRENRFFVTVPQVYPLSSNGDGALCSPSSHACVLVGTEQLSSVLASQPIWKKGKKKVVFTMAFDFFHSLSVTVVNAMASLSLPVCHCSFMTLELHVECRFVA